MRSLTLALSLLLGTALTSSLHAQDAPLDTTKLWRIITTDGNTYFGSILAQDETTLQLKTEVLGVIKLLPENVKAIDPVSETALAAGMLWADNPQAARHFWSPTGYGLKAGEGYYQNIWILYNQVSVGFNDYFSMGFGIIPVFLFGELSTPIWITPKLSVPIIEDKLNAGAGLFLGTILGESGSGGFGIAYGVGTLGSRDRNLTLGLGYGFADGEWTSQPITTLSGMYRISEKGYVITENFLLPKMGIMSFGGRTVWPKVALDYGGMVPVGVDDRIVIPWLGMTITIR